MLATIAFVLPGGRPRSSGGPWKVATYRPGLKVEYVPNGRTNAPRPYLDRVTVFFYESEATMLRALAAGRMDAAAPPATMNLTERLDELGIAYNGALGWESVWMDLRESLTPAERGAVVHAVRRRGLERGLVRSAGRLSNTLHPGPGGVSGIWRGTLGKKMKLREPIRMAIPVGDELLFLYQRGVEIDLAHAKIGVDLITGPYSDFYGRWRHAPPYDVALVRSAGAPGLRDRMRDAANLTALPLAHVRTYVAWNPGVEGLEANPTFDGPLWNMEEWWRQPHGG
jgi:hypothetical protein